MRVAEWIKKHWLDFKRITGGDAYGRYLAHWRQHHAPAGGEPLSREAFFRQEMERKWNGVKRCC